jgi:hypothetical protein
VSADDLVYLVVLYRVNSLEHDGLDSLGLIGLRVFDLPAVYLDMAISPVETDVCRIFHNSKLLRMLQILCAQNRRVASRP